MSQAGGKQIVEVDMNLGSQVNYLAAKNVGQAVVGLRE